MGKLCYMAKHIPHSTFNSILYGLGLVLSFSFYRPQKASKKPMVAATLGLPLPGKLVIPVQYHDVELWRMRPFDCKGIGVHMLVVDLVDRDLDTMCDCPAEKLILTFHLKLHY